MPTNALIVGVVFVPPAIVIFMPLLLLPLLGFPIDCPFPLVLVSLTLDEAGDDMFDVNEVTVDVRIVERDAPNVVTIKPCRTKSLYTTLSVKRSRLFVSFDIVA